MKKFTDKTHITCEQLWIGHRDDGRNHGNTVEVLEKKFPPDEIITHNVGDGDKRLRGLAKHIRKPLINRELKALPGRPHALTKANFPKSCSNFRLEKCFFFTILKEGLEVRASENQEHLLSHSECIHVPTQTSHFVGGHKIEHGMGWSGKTWSDETWINKTYHINISLHVLSLHSMPYYHSTPFHILSYAEWVGCLYQVMIAIQAPQITESCERTSQQCSQKCQHR